MTICLFIYLFTGAPAKCECSPSSRLELAAARAFCAVIALPSLPTALHAPLSVPALPIAARATSLRAYSLYVYAAPKTAFCWPDTQSTYI